jgi:hypothetical protein
VSRDGFGSGRATNSGMFASTQAAGSFVDCVRFCTRRLDRLLRRVGVVRALLGVLVRLLLCRLCIYFSEIRQHELMITYLHALDRRFLPPQTSLHPSLFPHPSPSAISPALASRNRISRALGIIVGVVSHSPRPLLCTEPPRRFQAKKKIYCY